MSRLDTENAVTDFLTSDFHKSLALHGRWGTGKTHVWKQVFQQNRHRITLKRYAYVSLFGISSLDQLKQSIFENIEPIATEDSEDSNVSKKWSIVVTNAEVYGRKVKSVFANLPFISQYVPGWKDFATYLDKFAFSLVYDTLVCFDDIERKGASLPLKDVMGILSFLQEQRRCKVVAIFNDGEFGSEADEYKTYREKVFERSVLLDPEPKECVQIVTTSTEAIWKRFASNVILLNVRNIRVIDHMKRNVHWIISSLKTKHPRVIEQAVDTVCIFVWAIQSPPSADIPPIEFLTSGRMNKAFGKVDDEVGKWLSSIRDYPFREADGFDRCLLQAIRLGFVDDVTIAGPISELERQFDNLAASAALDKAWSYFQDTYEHNESEIIEQVVTASKGGIEALSLSNLNANVSLLKKLGATREADDLITSFITYNTSKSRFFNLASHPFGREITDPDVRKALDAHFIAQGSTGRTLDEAIETIATGSLNPEDMARVAATPPGDIAEYFKRKTGRQLQSSRAGLLELARISNRSDDMTMAYENTVEALKLIGAESTLNRLRVQALGIVIDENTRPEGDGTDQTPTSIDPDAFPDPQEAQG